jgi:hypothetical protein
MNWVRSLCDALAPIDAEFAQDIRPASDEDIRRLASLLERDVPPDYLDFLHTMGGHDGGLFHFERCETSLPIVIDYLGRQRAAGHKVGRAECVPIAIGIEFEGYCLAMAGEPSHPPVAVIENMEPKEIAFLSLPAMAFGEAFFFEMGATGQTAFVTGLASQTSDSVVDKLGRAGYQNEWFSSPARIYFRASTKLVIVQAHQPNRPTLQVGGRDNNSLLGALADIRGLFDKYESRLFRQETLGEVRKLSRPPEVKDSTNS